VEDVVTDMIPAWTEAKGRAVDHLYDVVA
jgi:hypothetical protein